MAKVTGRSWIAAFVRHNRFWTAVGLLAIGGFMLWVGTLLNGQHDANWKAIIYGVGTAIVAAGLVTLIALEPEITQQLQSLTMLKMGEACQELGIQEFFASRSAKDDEFWADEIRKAKREYTVLGVASHRYIQSSAKQSAFRQHFLDAARRKVTVTFFFLNPTTDYAKRRSEEEGRDTIREIIETVEWLFQVKSALDASHQEYLKIYSYEDLPTIGITKVDDRLIIAHYLARELNADAPGMILFGDDDCVLVKKYDENLKEIAGHAFELTENPGADWRTRVGLPAAS